MEDYKVLIDKSNWAIGGGTLMGLGAGFFYLQKSALLFTACLLFGIGLGIMVTAIISRGTK